MKLSKEQNNLLAEKLSDLGNIALAGLTFASAFVKDGNIFITMLGIIIWFCCYIYALNLKRGE